MPNKEEKIRIILADDSFIVRRFLVGMLGQDPSVELVASVDNGMDAIEILKKSGADVMLLDVEMPKMDGLQALPIALKINPNLKVIMVSSFTTANAPATIKALSLGAADFVEKPSSVEDNQNRISNFRDNLLFKIKSLSKSTGRLKSAYESAQEKEVASSNNSLAKKDYVLRKFPNDFVPKALAIACSTGGPQALITLFPIIKKSNIINRIPIFVTQHMPAAFLTSLANHITKESGIECIEPKENQLVTAGRIYLSPGDFHMKIIKAETGGEKFTFTKDEPENFCRPSANPMLRSLVDVYGSSVISVTLTGLGQDGLDGAKKVAESGGIVIAQDEATSVVWGMPGAVAASGICNAIISLEKIAHYISNL